MGTRTVIYGHAYDGKHQDALNACLAYIRRNEGDHCLYLVRSDVRVQQLRSHMLREWGGCFHIPVATLPDQIVRLYRQAVGARRMIGSLEQRLLLETIFRQRVAESGTQFCFHRFSEHPGMLRNVLDFIITARREGIATPQQLDERFRRCSARRRDVYAELRRLAQMYAARLDDMRVIDETGIFLAMARRAEADDIGLRPFVSEPELLVLEGYYALTPPEQQIFSALCRRFERTVVTLDTVQNPYAPTTEPAKPFRIFEDLLAYIRASGFSVQSGRATRYADDDDARLRCVDGLFGSGTDGPASQASWHDAAEFLTLTTYRHKAEEVTAIAREIKRLAQEQPDLALREIGVTFPVVEQYETLIAEIFPLYGIPYVMTKGRALHASPVVVTILRVLEVVAQDYDRAAMSKLLMSPFAAFAGASGAAPAVLDADHFPALETLARMHGVVRGKTAWIDLLKAYEEDARRQQPESPERSADTLDEDHILRPGLLPVLSEFFAVMSRLESAAPLPVAEWIERLRECILRLQIPHRCLQAPDRGLREQHAAAFRGIMTVLATLREHAPAGARYSLQGVSDLLRRAVQQETYRAGEPLDDGVWIMGHLDTRHVQCAYLFFGGLIERDFPGRAEPNIFLSEQDAELFGLPTYAARVRETDHLFYANLLNATRRVYLSHPAREGDTDLLPAVYIDHIQRWKRDHAVSHDDAEHDHGPAITDQTGVSSDEAYTFTELIALLGMEQGRRERLSSRSQAMFAWLLAERGQSWTRGFVQGVAAHLAPTSGELGPFDGMITGAWGQRTMRRRYARHRFSASEFDLYARCPIRFLFERVLKVQPLREWSQEIERPEIGTLLHRIAFRFYAEPPERRPAGREGNVDVAFLQARADSAAWLRRAKSRLLDIVREELGACSYAGVFWERFSRTLLAGLSEDNGVKGKAAGIFSGFADQEAAADDGLLPWFVNANFGMPAEYQDAEAYALSETPLQISGPDAQGRERSVAIRGQIDRIDVERAVKGDVQHAVVYDYKTGKPQSIKKIHEGVSFQLPIYALAAQEFLGPKYAVTAAGYYQLDAPDTVGKTTYFGSKSARGYLRGKPRGLLENDDEFHQALEACKQHVIRIAEAIRIGRFHPSTLGPQHAGCSYCPYQRICRVDHQRMQAL